MKNIALIGMTCVALAAIGPASAGGDGEEIYKTRCASCHDSGLAGTPKLDDKVAWAPRIATGEEAMLATVVKGKGAMPPRGACGDCSDDDLKAAIAYMTSQVQ